jgi:hypothetical protein
MNTNTNRNYHTAAFAEAFFIGNLLFVGVFYLLLWVLYLLRYKDATAITRNHLKQTIVASSISTAIFISINLFIILTSGYASATALFSLEMYFMVFLPLCLVVGILGFSKAVKDLNFNYPLIGKLIRSADSR